MRLLERPAVPAPRLPLDLAAQVEAHRNLGAALGASAGIALPAQRRRRFRLLTVELPALVVAVVIAAIGIAVSGGTPAPAPLARQVGCVQDPVAGGCVVPEPVAQAGALYVDPTTPAARQVDEWAAQGRTADADALRALADRPVPLWLTGGADTTERVAAYVDRAAAAGALPLFVAYNMPDRDCGSFSAGGAADAAAYRSWVAAVAEGLGGAESVVVLEPDAVPHQLTGCVGEDGERYDLLAGAVDAFTAAGARVYVDAGNPGFTGDPAATADALRRAGVERAAGFSLNVANFYSTGASVAYGTAISEALGGGVRFVIDTSRNGAGRLLDAADGAPTWCNPPDRMLGTAPTLDTGLPLVDALLWIKRPGESDGSCRPGEPEAGGWFPDYALDLVDG
ncbi:glycoside hydrolase family 6 protein [Pseudonocardia hydrocarbonoxydans]|uniref:glycoside hydrolase family 6 protein n=1 Tax=Pseudonocardia hydrocarbonoxydans TaxID=76726 RepID=UPI001FE33F4C|nr:glycoside hydrolase family 6 protein [Pseudonocardia hydrocarbonoxydans]